MAALGPSHRRGRGGPGHCGRMARQAAFDERGEGDASSLPGGVLPVDVGRGSLQPGPSHRGRLALHGEGGGAAFHGMLARGDVGVGREGGGCAARRIFPEAGFERDERTLLLEGLAGQLGGLASITCQVRLGPRPCLPVQGPQHGECEQGGAQQGFDQAAAAIGPSGKVAGGRVGGGQCV